MSVETDLLRALPDGPLADAQHAMPRVEAAVRSMIERLSSADTLALQQRLKRGHESDELVRRFRRLGGTRQANLEAVLRDSKRRARIRNEEARDASRATPSIDEGGSIEALGQEGSDTQSSTEPGDASPATIATAATEGPGVRLPHADAIQASFGRHDISRVRAHHGPAAEEAGAQLGAKAFAIGDAVAFASPPDLHTAAHEAAHTVQQRGTVQRTGDVDPGDDPHERHADAVADAVVAGRSAEPLLDHAAGGTATSRVQRKPAEQALRGADYGFAPLPPLAVEPEIRALLSERITSHDIPRLQRRKTSLLILFRAIPTSDRDQLRAQLLDKQSDLGRLFQHALSTKLRSDLLATLDGAVIPAPARTDAVEMDAFASTVTAGRFHANREVVLDAAWRASQSISIVAVRGFGPPANEPAPQVQWRLVDRMGEIRQAGAVTWAPATGAPDAIEVTIDEPGRWEVWIEVVDRGHAIAVLSKPVMARSAVESGADLPALLEGNDVAKAAAAMSDAQLGEQLGALRGRLGAHELGSLKKDDPTFRRMTAAIEELQWQQHQRGLKASNAPPPPFEEKDFDASSADRRAAIQQALDGMIARYGIKGTRARLHDMIVVPVGAGQGAGAQPSVAGPRSAEIERMLGAELDLREQEAAGFLGRFDAHARGVAFGLLAESKARLSAERARYGLKEEGAQDGGYGTQGPAGTDVRALQDAVDHGKQIKAAHDKVNAAVRARTSGGTESAIEDARKEYEAAKLIAVAKHPMLKAFLDGETRQAAWAPTGMVPGLLDLGSYGAKHFGMYMGWELNKKLGDLDKTHDNITTGKLSVFGVPKVVELAKSGMHVAPGSVHDGVINERSAENASQKDWTADLLAVLTVALGLMLALPSGGTSIVGAGIATAGEITLLAADLYLLGKDFDQRDIYHAATNTDTSVADSLLKEEPAAGPIILRVFGMLGPVAGVAGVARAGSNLTNNVARAREGIEAVRSVRRAADAADQVMTDPKVVEAVERLRPIGRAAGMTDEEIDALVRNLGRKGIGGAARVATTTADATAAITKEMAPELARRLGVGRIEISGVAGEVGVRPTMRNGRVVVDEVVVGPAATVGDVMAHGATVEMLERYNGVAGKMRQAWDEIAEVVTGVERRNLHAAFTEAHEAYAEVRKYEQMIRGRMTDLVTNLAHAGPKGAAAANRIDDEILLMEGELSHWRGVLDDVKRTGDLGLARGLIEARDIGKVTDDAIEAKYPAPPSAAYHYRRWPHGGGPEGQEFQLVKRGGTDPTLPALQPRRSGKDWVLKEYEGGDRVPKVFESTLGDDQVFAGVFAQSESLQEYIKALTDPRGIAMDAKVVRTRALAAVERVRIPRRATADEIARGARRAVDEDNLRHALKREFREEFFTAAAREKTAAGQHAKIHELTNGLNQSDRGNIIEDFMARRDPGSVRHVDVTEGDLAAATNQGARTSATANKKVRQIDRMRPDGTAVEVKSGKGRLSPNEADQLNDYAKMIGQFVDVNGIRTEIKQVVYQITDSRGVKANLDIIAGKANARFGFEVFSASGQQRTITNDNQLEDILEWLKQ
ncbi:MAG: DUF4157 domain-containing protein [Kofleriaceae bacterium]